jgi:hypothetical protein
MPDTPNLRPATRDELMQSVSFALRFNGRKREHGADETMARITAERLVEHLERSGYVVMHKPPLGQHGAPGNLARWIDMKFSHAPEGHRTHARSVRGHSGSRLQAASNPSGAAISAGSTPAFSTRTRLPMVFATG